MLELDSLMCSRSGRVTLVLGAEEVDDRFMASFTEYQEYPRPDDEGRPPTEPPDVKPPASNPLGEPGRVDWSAPSRPGVDYRPEGDARPGRGYIPGGEAGHTASSAPDDRTLQELRNRFRVPDTNVLRQTRAAPRVQERPRVQEQPEQHEQRDRSELPGGPELGDAGADGPGADRVGREADLRLLSDRLA